MNFVPKMMDFVFQMTDCVIKMTGFQENMRRANSTCSGDCVSGSPRPMPMYGFFRVDMMDFALKMMNLALDMMDFVY